MNDAAGDMHTQKSRPASFRLALAAVALTLAGCGTKETQETSKLSAPPLLTVAGADSGITFRHQTATPGSYSLPEIMGSGVCLLDVERDGDLDIFFANLGTNYSTVNESLSEPCRLFRQTAPGRFEDATDELRVGFRDVGMGAAVGDANNDGFPDLYLTNFGADRLLLNRGGQHFDDVTEAAGIFNPYWATSASWFDFDRDGWLDVMVANYVDFTGLKCELLAGGQQDYCAPARFQSVSSKLYRNMTGSLSDDERARGLVKFEDVSTAAGLAAKSSPALGLICGDLTGDGWPDIFVANDQMANFMWVNQRDGTFREDGVLLGVAVDIRGVAQGSMGTAAVDMNRDQRLDLLVTNLAGEGHALYLSDAQGGFTESATHSGLRRMTLPGTGFGLGAVDLDDDGECDLLAANGAVRRPETVSASKDFWSPYRQPLQLLLGKGGGQFESTSAVPESFLQARHVSRGLAVGDLDNDGDSDVIVTHIGDAPEVFWNTCDKRGTGINLRAIEPQRGGRDAIGAIVSVRAGGREWTQLVQPGTSYLSSHDPRLHFGLGSVDGIERVVVQWPDGSRERFSVELPALHVTLRKGDGRPDDVASSR